MLRKTVSAFRFSSVDPALAFLLDAAAPMVLTAGDGRGGSGGGGGGGRNGGAWLVLTKEWNSAKIARSTLSSRCSSRFCSLASASCCVRLRASSDAAGEGAEASQRHGQEQRRLCAPSSPPAAPPSSEPGLRSREPRPFPCPRPREPRRLSCPHRTAARRSVLPFRNDLW